MNAPRRANKSPEAKMAASRLYDQDFYAWANEQAALLRAGKLSQADIEHIAEEVESLGKTEKRELASRSPQGFDSSPSEMATPAVQANAELGSID